MAGQTDSLAPRRRPPQRTTTRQYSHCIWRVANYSASWWVCFEVTSTPRAAQRKDAFLISKRVGPVEFASLACCTASPRWRRRAPLLSDYLPPPPPPSGPSSSLPASASGHHQQPGLPPFLWATAAVLGPVSATEQPPAPRRPPLSRRRRLRTVGKRGYQDYRIGYAYSLQFCSGWHCFSGEALGMGITIQEARSANDSVRNPSEDALSSFTGM